MLNPWQHSGPRLEISNALAPMSSAVMPFSTEAKIKGLSKSILAPQTSPPAPRSARLSWTWLP